MVFLKKYLLLILLVAIIIVTSGCIGSGGTGSGEIVNETVKVSGFDQVALDGMGTLIITQGNNESLIIEAEDNVIPHIKTSVNNNKLQISYDNISTPTPTKPVIFHLSVKNLSSIDVSGAAKMNAVNLKSDQLNVFLNGAAEGNLTNLQLKSLILTISGAGNLNASGKADAQTITINGAGEYSAISLNTSNTTVTINGAGKTTVKVSDILNAVINGGGEVVYFGNPNVTQQINGMGQINQAVY